MKKLIYSASAIAALALFYFACLNHVDAGEVGLAYNSGNGEVYTQPPGWHVTSPLVRVSCLPTTPFWVEIYTKAVIKPRRLVRFVPEAAADFVSLQGFGYWGAAVGYGSDSNEYLFSGYAFSGKSYPFLEILE